MRIVALHGFTGEGADFDLLRPLLPAGHELVAPDLPGHGSRRDLRQVADYSLPAHLSIIDAAVGGGDALTLLGYSMGGRLALHWALAHPGRWRRLVLIGASPGLDSAAERSERRLADAALATFLRTQGLAAFYKYWHHQPMLRTLFQPSSPRREELLQRRAGNDAEGLALSLESVGTGSLPSLWPRLGELRGNVDLVTGEHDPKFTELARRMGEKIPRTRMSVVEGVGHAVHLERPADLATLLAG
ncbi:2-succinyl-6-hydroxy-2,4-cyclohexadiene-1-carboxylate synthase [bacterium]|nr:2-succinyl-6-hydroxy-2,4-cyclohexadiene-1-carboxylate synthase [bacterium]